MYENETLLTPMFRLILNVIENNGISNCLKSSNELKTIRTHLEIDNVEIGIQKQQVYLHLIDNVRQLLDMKADGKADLCEFWKTNYEKIQTDVCNGCYKCKKCKEYFWLELGEIICGRDNEEKEKGIYFPVRKIPDSIRKCLEPSLNISELYSKYAKANRISEDNVLVVLKGMSSSTPAMLNSLYDTTAFSGGGFYLRYNGLGIAIDPGYYFVHNLHHYGYSILDIDIVIITHEHIDHNNDVRLLDDLFANVKRSDDEKIIWILDDVTYQVAKIYQENGTGFNSNKNVLCKVIPEDHKYSATSSEMEVDTMLRNHKISIDFFPTYHIEDKKKKEFRTHTFGCSFISDLDMKKVSYTSDTSYYPELVDYISKSDVLIANISGIYEDDFMLVKAKKRHLGYHGCYHLLRNEYIKYGQIPKLVLLSEFWNGKHDIRYDVAKQLKYQIQETSAEKVNIVPAELGMIVNPKTQSMKCCACGKMVKNYIILRPIEFNGKIQCFCDECFYSN